MTPGRRTRLGGLAITVGMGYPSVNWVGARLSADLVVAVVAVLLQRRTPAPAAPDREPMAAPVGAEGR